MRVFLTILLTTLAFSQNKSIASFSKGMSKSTGYFTTYYDKSNDQLYLQIDEFDQRFIYVNSLPAGVGSNDIGLDRGQIGDVKLVQFEKHGRKVFLKQINMDYRAVSNNPLEARSVEQAFAQAVIWGFSIEAQSKNSVLIKLNDFLLRDSHGVVKTLRRKNQGNLSLDQSRSALYLPMTKNFPHNTEFEATLTFTGDITSRELYSVTPDANSLTVRMHHSFVKRPDNKYKTRVDHPYSGMISFSYADYAAPVDQSLEKRLIYRHRLIKKDPTAALSEVVEPIIYYVDPGAPEPIRSALVEGASWWIKAFEAAGFKNAFQVKILPADADPMDVRYNMIQWVHRKTRGWSYGTFIADPETGEIIKGHVSLGSLRIRQDFMIAQGLLSPYDKKDANTAPMLEMALARIRQLSAHEVGHTIGIAHNFAASISARASVMDYPHPLIKLKNNTIDLSDAYAVGIGDWDKVAVAYGYSQAAKTETEEAMLTRILEKAKADGLQFISDNDARPKGGMHPAAHLWDNGADAASELSRILEVRKYALSKFSEKNIAFGEPLSSLENVLVPIYFLHRYQAEAAVKLLGGMNYSFAVRGDDPNYSNRIVQPRVQRAALAALIDALSAKGLALPEHILNLIPPQAQGYARNREQFQLKTGLNLDAIGIAETAAAEILSMMFHPQRLNRLVEFNARNAANPSLFYILEQLDKSFWQKNQSTLYLKEVQDALNAVYLNQLLHSAQDKAVSTKAQAILYHSIMQTKSWLKNEVNDTDHLTRKALYQLMLAKIEKFERELNVVETAHPRDLPPGSPIGQ